MRCQACRRPLTNPVSLQHGLGPDCLRRAVRAGTAPLTALEELTTWKRENVKKPRPNRQAAQPVTDAQTIDLFEQLKAAAMDDLNKAVANCMSVGISVKLNFEETI